MVVQRYLDSSFLVARASFSRCCLAPSLIGCSLELIAEGVRGLGEGKTFRTKSSLFREQRNWPFTPLSASWTTTWATKLPGGTFSETRATFGGHKVGRDDKDDVDDVDWMVGEVKWELIGDGDDDMEFPESDMCSFVGSAMFVLLMPGSCATPRPNAPLPDWSALDQLFPSKVRSETAWSVFMTIFGGLSLTSRTTTTTTASAVSDSCPPSAARTRKR